MTTASATYSNVVIMPLEKIAKAGPSDEHLGIKSLYSGGAFVMSGDNNYQFIPESSISRFGSPILEPSSGLPPIAAADYRVTGLSLYGGPLILHYGHFITEVVSRLWAYTPSVENIVFLLPTTYKRGLHVATKILPKFAIDLFGLLGIPLEKLVISSSQVITCENLCIPEPGFELPGRLDADYREFVIKKVSETFTPKKPGSNKVYLSRSRLSQGLVAGEPELERILFLAGFDIIYPEQRSLTENLERLSDIELVLGFSGSAFHKLLFLPHPPSAIIELCRRKWSNQTQKAINSAIGAESHEFDFIIDQHGSGSAAVSKYDVHETCKALSKMGHLDDHLCSLIDKKQIDEDYSWLCTYYNFKHGLESIEESSLNPDKLNQLISLAQYRQSAGIAIYAAKLCIKLSMKRQCLEALNLARTYGASMRDLNKITDLLLENMAIKQK